MKIENLRFSYFDNGTEKNIFNGLNLQSDSGIICFMGPSGCGKTTLLHIIAGLIRPCDGTVSDFPSNCSVMFQEDRLLPWLNAWANVALVDKDRRNIRRNPQTTDKASSVLKEVGIDPEMPISSMSGGMKRRVALARALAFESEALILDEPFKGLDEDLMQKCAALVKAQEKPVLVSTHSEAEAKVLGAQIIRLS